ncbi:MAG: HepT-like ribonuclease domain-containing protein [Candidatus Methanomethylicia archaeon]
MNDEYSKRLELWIGFRNILVHAYASIDVAKVFDAMSKIEELEEIIKQISKSLESKSIDPKDTENMSETLIEKLRVFSIQEASYCLHTFSALK